MGPLCSKSSAFKVAPQWSLPLSASSGIPLKQATTHFFCKHIPLELSLKLSLKHSFKMKRLYMILSKNGLWYDLPAFFSCRLKTFWLLSFCLGFFLNSVVHCTEWKHSLAYFCCYILVTSERKAKRHPFFLHLFCDIQPQCQGPWGEPAGDL